MMKTVKEVSEITGVTIRTLRYYDEIGLLKPTQLTDAGYRLYDQNALEKLQLIMFFRELEIPLVDIKKIMENTNWNKEEVLSAQKSFLLKKRARLNGLIDLITDVMKGVNTMSFEAFNHGDLQKIINHTLENMTQESLNDQIRQYGSIDKYREHLYQGLQNEKALIDIFKWYGGKDKASDAVLQSAGNHEELASNQNINDEVYRQLVKAKETKDMDLEKEAVTKLTEVYKGLFKIDNARSILLDLGKEYLKNDKLAEATDNEYGKGSAEYIAQAIFRYYGV